jgi:predicted ATPase
MTPYIKSLNPNLLNGSFTVRIDFQPSFNIISGENGTGKTQLLASLKKRPGPGGERFAEQTKIEISDGDINSLRVQAISPQINAERKSFLGAFQEMRRNDKKIDQYLEQINQQMINDSTFVTYPSVAEHYYYEYEELCLDGGDRKKRMEIATDKLNKIIQSIMDNLELHAEWDNTTGNPKLSVCKSGTEFPIDALSCGEKEILALILNLYLSREKFDVFLIDEPEIHLNWHLEEKLFKHLKEFCSVYQKQIILSTHSRVIFKSEFLNDVQFLYWENGKVICNKEISEDQRRRIAGEAIENIKLGSFGKPTFFVEDNIHALVVKEMAKQANVEILVSVAGNSENVKSLFKLSKNEGKWPNSYFIIDGDNQGNPFPNEINFVHLDKYCMQNYLLDFNVCAEISSKTPDEIQSGILKAIKNNQLAILNKNRFFYFLFERLKEADVTETSLVCLDASKIFPQFIRDIGFPDEEDFVKAYIKYCYISSKQDILPQKIYEIIQQNARELVVTA